MMMIIELIFQTVLLYTLYLEKLPSQLDTVQIISTE